jgi:hypothetical protein
MINCAAIVSRSGAGPITTRAPRRCRAPGADVDADDGAARFRNSRAAHDEHDISGVGVDLGREASRRERFDDRVLDDAAELEQGSLEVGSGTDLHREAQPPASGKPVVRRERRQKVGEERLEAHRAARAEVP